jgi:hypothetical protein
MHTGLVALPVNGEAYVGGRAMIGVGYDNHSWILLVRNSW